MQQYDDLDIKTDDKVAIMGIRLCINLEIRAPN